MSNSATALRRWLGVFCLAVASGMLIWGQTLLEPYLEGKLFIAYWIVFVVFTCGTVGVSLLDFLAVRRELVEDIALLKARALQEIEARSSEQAPSSPGPGRERTEDVVSQ